MHFASKCTFFNVLCDSLHQASYRKASSLEHNMEITMTQYGTWSPYVGSNSILLAVVLLIVTGVLIFLAYSITSSHRSQKTWKVSWRFYRRDLVVVCDNVPGCSNHLRKCAVSAGGSVHWANESNNSHYNALRIGCLFRDRIPGKTERVLGRFWERHCWDNSCADDLRTPIRSHRYVANVSPHS